MIPFLSIVIPTLNRQNYLEFTVSHFLQQIQRNVRLVEFIVCNNASDDNTDEMMNSIYKSYSFIKYICFKDRVELGMSFERTIAQAQGKYVILWGDDDIPAPYLVEYLLDVTNRFPQAGLIHFNRLVGYENGNPIKSLSVYKSNYNNLEILYDNVSDFITENFWGATFMSSDLFLRSAWLEGLGYNTDSHYGFEFMAKIYYGVRNIKCLYVSYPLCIQRKVAKRAWGDKWPQYALLGLPNMASDMERDGLFENGLAVWNSKNNKFTLFCYILLCAASYKKFYKPLCKEINKYQNGFFRQFLTYTVIYLTPSFLYKWSRVFLFKFKNK